MTSPPHLLGPAYYRPGWRIGRRDMIGDFIAGGRGALPEGRAGCFFVGFCFLAIHPPLLFRACHSGDRGETKPASPTAAAQQEGRGRGLAHGRCIADLETRLPERHLGRGRDTVPYPDARGVGAGERQLVAQVDHRSKSPHSSIAAESVARRASAVYPS